MNRLFLLTLLLVAGLAHAADNVDHVNGAIEIAAGQQAGNLSTVNGAIRLGDGAHAGSASTVNGSITLGARAVAESLSTVNGGVRLGTGAQVAKSVSTVNGAVILAQGAQVGGDVGNVNGAIRLTGAAIDGGLRTVSGDIDIGAGSVVKGGLIVDKESGWSLFHFWGSAPRVVIGPGASVDGTLDFRRTVRLYVSDRAHVGVIKGATPIRFSGATPPGA